MYEDLFARTAELECNDPHDKRLGRVASHMWKLYLEHPANSILGLKTSEGQILKKFFSYPRELQVELCDALEAKWAIDANKEEMESAPTLRDFNSLSPEELCADSQIPSEGPCS